jgi:N-acetylglucosamine kinase-like BadF-type ATPase
MVGRDECGQVLFQAILSAFSSAGFKTRDIISAEGSLPLVKSVCIGMRGVEKPKDEAAVRRIITEFNLGENTKIVVSSEARIVLESGLANGIGVAVLSGENGLVFGQGPDLRAAKAGGDGYLLGDEGSAHYLGLQAVKAVLRAADGRGPATQLTAMVERTWKITPGRPDLVAAHAYDLLKGLGTGGNKALVEETTQAYKQALANLAPLVEQAAAKADEASGRILDTCADEIVLAVQAVLRRTALDSWTKPTPLVLSGSILLSNQGELKRRLLERLPDMAEPVPVLEAAEGALKLALNFS